MRGTIGVISGELVRFATFAADVTVLAQACARFPEAQLPVMWQRGGDICSNRNRIVTAMYSPARLVIGDDEIDAVIFVGGQFLHRNIHGVAS